MTYFQRRLQAVTPLACSESGTGLSLEPRRLELIRAAAQVLHSAADTPPTSTDLNSWQAAAEWLEARHG